MPKDLFRYAVSFYSDFNYACLLYYTIKYFQRNKKLLIYVFFRTYLKLASGICNSRIWTKITWKSYAILEPRIRLCLCQSQISSLKILQSSLKMTFGIWSKIHMILDIPKMQLIQKSAFLFNWNVAHDMLINVVFKLRPEVLTHCGVRFPWVNLLAQFFETLILANSYGITFGTNTNTCRVKHVSIVITHPLAYITRSHEAKYYTFEERGGFVMLAACICRSRLIPWRGSTHNHT
jgi:hypothetical protein